MKHRIRRRNWLIRGGAITVALVVGVIGFIAQWATAGATALTVVATAQGANAWTPDKPLFVLLLGDDTRANAGCGCTDAMHLVSIPAGGGSAVFLNIPRDTYVEVPGHGHLKINSAYAYGKEQLTAQVVSKLVGAPVHYTMVTRFEELSHMIDELGGVTVDVPYGMSDSFSGAHFAKGPRAMTGADALAFSRDRHLAGGDFARSNNQARLILAVLAKLRVDASNPATTLRDLAVFLRHGRSSASIADLYRLGRLALTIDPAKVTSVVMPGHSATVGGASVVLPDPPAQQLFADIADNGKLDTFVPAAQP